jgi:hypothetical protein
MNQKQLNELLDHHAKSFRVSLRGHRAAGTKGLKPEYSKKRVDDICSGFSDGQASVVAHLMELGILKLDES